MSETDTTLRPDPGDQRERFADRLREAGVSTQRFIDVHDGGKGTRNHTQRGPNAGKLKGNYGVYGGLGGDSDVADDPAADDFDIADPHIDVRWLVDVDVDDYENDGSETTDGLESLPETFTIESPHTDGDTGGHRYYAVKGHVAKAFYDRLNETKNPSPPWGEVRVSNQYCVGPGSQIQTGGCVHDWCDPDDGGCAGCDKQWCDECAKADGGYYRIAKDLPIAVLELDEFVDAILTDLETDPTPTDPPATDADADTTETAGEIPEYEPNPNAEIEDVLARKPWIGTYLALGPKAVIGEDDRSNADWRVCKDMIKAGVSEDDTRELLEESEKTKVSERGDDYWSRTWPRAIESVVRECAEDDEPVPWEGGYDDGGELPDPSPHGFDAHNGGYGYWSQNDDKTDEWIEWTNFEIEVNAFLSLDDGSEEIELTVHPRHGDPYAIVVAPTAFNEKRSFKKEVACGRTATFTGGGDALAKIKQFVGTQPAPELTGVRHMGRHGAELVLPDGSLTVDGWNDDPERRYIEQSLGSERKLLLTRGDDPGADDADAIEATTRTLDLLPRTRDPERFLPVIGWFYAAPLRPVLTEAVNLGEFPVLSITGGTGAGKTSTLELLWELIGVGGDPFGANGTNFPVMRNVGATDTFPIWLDEYKPSDMRSDRRDGLHDIVRKSTRGGVVSKGNADLTTTEFHLRAPVVVSGEQRFAGPAEQRRSILTTFRETTTDPDGDHAHAFAQLSGGSYRDPDTGEIEHYDGVDTTAHAFAYYRWLLSLDREEIAEAWLSAGERVLSLLDEYGLGGIDSAGRTALQTIAFGLGLYRAFADDLDAEAPIDQDDADRALVYVAKQQGNDGRRESHLDEFVRYLSLSAMDNELVEERHYTRTKNKALGEWEIRVNMSRAYPKVARYIRNHGLDDRAELLGESDYRERIKEQAEADGDDSYITRYSHPTDPVGRAFGVSIPRAEQAIEAFDDDHFYGRDDDIDSHEEHWRREQ